MHYLLLLGDVGDLATAVACMVLQGLILSLSDIGCELGGAGGISARWAVAE